MSDSTGLIAIDLVENADVEHPVMDDEKEYRPFHKRPVESPDTFLDECSFIIEVLDGEEIARRYEKQGHVVFKDKPAEPTWSLCMCYHHQDNSDAFADGYGRITFHGSKHEGEQMPEPAFELMPSILAFLQILS